MWRTNRIKTSVSVFEMPFEKNAGVKKTYKEEILDKVPKDLGRSPVKLLKERSLKEQTEILVH